MRLYFYITMGEDGRVTVTHHEPVWARVEGTQRYAPYPRVTEGTDGELVGDGILWRELCKEWAEKVLGELPPPGEPVRMRLDLERADTKGTSNAD